MKIENKEDVVNFIEAHLKELGGEAYGVNYIAEKLFEWHESELKNLRLGVVVGRSEQLVCGFCSSTENVEEIPVCDNCWDRVNNH